MQIFNLTLVLSLLEGCRYGNQFLEQILEKHHRLAQSQIIPESVEPIFTIFAPYGKY